MSNQNNSNVVVEQVVRRTTRSQAVAVAGAGPSEPAVDSGTQPQTSVTHIQQSGASHDISVTESPPTKGKGKKGKKTSRPTVYSLSQAVTGLQQFATGSTNEMSVIRNEVTTNNQMITGLYSRMDTMMNAISNVFSI